MSSCPTVSLPERGDVRGPTGKGACPVFGPARRRATSFASEVLALGPRRPAAATVTHRTGRGGQAGAFPSAPGPVRLSQGHNRSQSRVLGDRVAHSHGDRVQSQKSGKHSDRVGSPSWGSGGSRSRGTAQGGNSPRHSHSFPARTGPQAGSPLCPLLPGRWHQHVCDVKTRAGAHTGDQFPPAASPLLNHWSKSVFLMLVCR